MLHNIMVPLDGTRFGEHALPLALGLARRSGAHVHLIHVHAALSVTYAEVAAFEAPRLDEQIRHTEEEYLARLRQDIESRSGIAVSVQNVHGDTVPAIQGLVETTRADLVVMATHGRGPVGRFWLGSLADELVRELKTPLLLVHPQKGVADLGADIALKHILIPLDGTPHGERIVEPAAELAKLNGADVTLLRVVEPVYPTVFPSEFSSLGDMGPEVVERIERVQAKLKEDAEVYLEGVAEHLRARGLDVRIGAVAEDSPSSAIIEESHRPVDLIAMETHGRHGLSRLLVGSVADKVIRGSTIPVLVHCSHG